MLREAVHAGTPLGREVESVMASGGLIDDTLMTRIVETRLQQPDVARGFLLDGFPRTIAQAGVARRDGAQARSALVVVELALADEAVVKRLASRLVCTDCGVNRQDDGDYPTCHDCGGPLVPRSDDREQVVRTRLEVYRKQTAPLVSYYEPRADVLSGEWRTTLRLRRRRHRPRRGAGDRGWRRFVETKKAGGLREEAGGLGKRE